MSTSPNPPPSNEAISRRAKAIWEGEGRPEGQDLAIWLRAEMELVENAGPFESSERARESAPSRATGAAAAPKSASPRKR